MDVGAARDIVLSEYNAEEYDHFGKVAFRLKPKKPGAKPGRTFMTLWLDEGFVVLMLDNALQADLLDHPSGAFEKHPSKWGEKGATVMRLAKVGPGLFRETTAMAIGHAGR